MLRLNRSFFATMALMLAALVLLPGCTPGLNWRDVRLGNTRLALLLPCKPDKAEKTVPLGGQPTVLTMVGCNAGGATFAVAVADLGDASKAAAVLGQWQSLTLANMKAPPVGASAGESGASYQPQTQTSVIKLAGAGGQPTAVLVKAFGTRADGRPVMGQAAYFAQGSQVFQAVVYADRIAPELSDTYFSSLKFQ
jgi:hypothetical protein